MKHARSIAWVAVVVLVVAIGHTLAFREHRAGTPAFVAWATGPTALLAALVCVRDARIGRLEEWLLPKWGDITRGFFGGLALFLAAFAFTKLALPPGSPREAWIARVYLQLGDPTALRDHLARTAAVIVGASVAEEFVWRGFVQGELAATFGDRAAWVGSTLAYALAHVGTMFVMKDPTVGLNPLLVVGALGAGIAFATLRRVFGTVLPAIVAHAVFDWAVVMLFRLWGPSV